MAAYRRIYDSRHLQADCQEPGSAPEPCARQSTIGYLYLFTSVTRRIKHSSRRPKVGRRVDKAAAPAIICQHEVNVGEIKAAVAGYLASSWCPDVCFASVCSSFYVFRLEFRV